MGTPAKNRSTDTQNQPNSGQGVNFEKRYKDTQAAYTRSQQEGKAKDAVIAKLQEQIAKTPVFTQQQQDELSELRDTDVDAYAMRLQEFTQEHQKRVAKEIEQFTSQAAESVQEEVKAQSLKQAVEMFNQSHPDKVISEDNLANDVPPRLTKQLEEGSVSYEEFVDKASKFINHEYATANPETMNQPNLNDQPGSNTPSSEEDDDVSYEDGIY